MTGFPESHRDLLEAQTVAILSTIDPRGFPQSTALWFLLDEDGKLRLAVNSSRKKLDNLRARPECTLFILDVNNIYKTIEVRARATVELDEGYALSDRVGRKYNDDLRRFDPPGTTRYAVTLDPVRINTTPAGR
jgi:PPOX class probable F420-dependent enzyme